jgi:hypothetical protein
MRAVLPLAVLATNGRGVLDVAGLPRHDALGAAPDAEAALRVAGVALVVASAVLRVLAKGVLVRRATLTTGGVYGVVRHPFYLANLVGAVGVFLVAGLLGAAVGAAWLAVAIPVYVVTIRGEEAALAALFPAQWSAYGGRVRALVPGLPPPDREPARVTWANLRAEREPPRLLRFAGGAAAVLALTLAAPGAWVALAAACAVFAASYVVR